MKKLLRHTLGAALVMIGLSLVIWSVYGSTKESIFLWLSSACTGLVIVMSGITVLKEGVRAIVEVIRDGLLGF
jgi:hypothetical protein